MKIYDPDASLDLLTQECLKPAAESVFRKHLTVLFDFDTNVVPLDSIWLKSVFQKMLVLAVERSPMWGEIEVTACRVGAAVEIEVADVGEVTAELTQVAAFQCFSNQTFLGATLSELVGSIRARGAEFWGTACPQGGMAWTLRCPYAQRLARTA
jgi:K+-sensing histidine kinase KdpD